MYFNRDLSFNSLSGTIPTEFGRIASGELRYLFVILFSNLISYSFGLLVLIQHY